MASTFSFSRRVRGQDIVLAHVPLPSPEMTQNSSNFGLTFEGEGVNRSGLRSLSSICAGTSAWLLPGRGFLTVKKPCPVVQQTAPATRRNRYEASIPVRDLSLGVLMHLSCTTYGRSLGGGEGAMGCSLFFLYL